MIAASAVRPARELYRELRRPFLHQRLAVFLTGIGMRWRHFLPENDFSAKILAERACKAGSARNPT